jgi:hypothetical protein
MRLAETVGRIGSLLLALSLAADASGAAESACPTPPEEVAAETWRMGDAIPPRLLVFKDNADAWEGMPVCGDSRAVIPYLGNYSFLLALATDPRADERVTDLAVERALLLRGPSTVFADLSAAYRRSPVLLQAAVHRSLRGRMRQRHVWVSGLEVQPKELGELRSPAVVAEIAARLRQGAQCADIREEYSQRFRNDAGYWIELLGSLVVPEVRDEKQRHLDQLLPASHMRRLLAAHAGDVVIFARPRGAFGVRYGPYKVLWQVHEVYTPPPSQE